MKCRSSTTTKENPVSDAVMTQGTVLPILFIYLLIVECSAAMRSTEEKLPSDTET